MRNALTHWLLPVTINVVESETEIVIAVADCGPGAPIDALAELRRPFASADQARASTGNVGPEPAIIDMSGHLDFRNLPQEGFEALLRLPMGTG